MAIRLNLLAESQAAEETRRRDPVKRAMWVGGVLVGVMLAWSISLQGRAMVAKREVEKVERAMNVFTNDYRDVVANLNKVREVQSKVTALNNLARERFLHAPVLNALQRATMDDVQMLHYRTDQGYMPTEAVKPKTNDVGRVIAGKPATVTERITVFLDASDGSSNPGDQVTKFKEIVSGVPYVKELLGKTNSLSLKNLSQPMLLPVPGSPLGKSCVMFTLETKLQEKTR
jgi:hypothetical protein